MSGVSVTATIAPGRRQLVNVRRELLLTAKMRVVWLRKRASKSSSLPSFVW